MKNLALLSKRGIISLLFVFMVILTLQDAIAQTITIGRTSSTSVSTYFPLSRRALYNRCEIIYTKAEINTAGAGAGNISQISFYKNASETSLDITAVKVYMKHTTSSTLSSGSWSTTGYTLVFSGTVTNSNAAGWKTINLSTPFAYNNVDNLEIAIDHGSQSTSTSYPSWKYTSTASNTVRYAYGSTAPTTLSTVTYARPVIQMVFASSALTANAGTDKSICSGNSTTLTTTVSGGTSPYNYLWSTGANTASISVSPASTTTYTVTVTDAASSTANDNVVVNVTSSVTPSVSISANPSGTVTPGTSVTFTATPTNGGTPTYQWKKGGTNISGATSSTYTYIPIEGDVISCSMTSTATCANPTTVTSNSITMAVRTVSSLPTGTAGQTLRHDGTDWVANSLLYNNGTNIGIGTTTPTNILDVATGTSNSFGNYALIRTSSSVGYQGGLLFTNAPATNTDYTSLKITSSYNGSLNINTNAKFGFVRNSATEAWLNNGPAIQLAASTGNVYIAQGNGNVLIGKTSQLNTEYKLDVAGKIRANEIVVNTDGADFVFDDTYELMSLTKLEKYIKENKHLPLVPSAIKMQKEGMSVSETNTILLQKIEELTLYIIEQNKKIENLQKKVEVLENK